MMDTCVGFLSQQLPHTLKLAYGVAGWLPEASDTRLWLLLRGKKEVDVEAG